MLKNNPEAKKTSQESRIRIRHSKNLRRPEHQRLKSVLEVYQIKTSRLWRHSTVIKGSNSYQRQ